MQYNNLGQFNVKPQPRTKVNKSRFKNSRTNLVNSLPNETCLLPPCKLRALLFIFLIGKICTDLYA